MPKGVKGFQKGHKLATGRPRTTIIVKEVQKMNNDDVILSMNKIAHMNKEQLRELTLNPDTPMYELALARIMFNAVTEGNTTSMDFFLNRLVGKPKEQIEHSGSMTYPEFVRASYKVLGVDKKDEK